MWNVWLKAIQAGEALSADEMREAMNLITDGKVSEAIAAAFLMGLSTRVETPEEIAAAASVLRAKLIPVDCNDDFAIDTCGTGGDGISTFNISTAAAIVASAAGATVAKHGNHTNSRASGSADVVRELASDLGFNLDATPDELARALRTRRLAFLYAPKLHPAMANVAPVRKQLGVRTIFNLLGPLANPARVRRQIIGTPNPQLARTMAETLALLDDPPCERGWVICGHHETRPGQCDLTLSGPSLVYEVIRGQITELEIDPGDYSLPRADDAAFLVKTPRESADAIRRVLAGENSYRRDIVLLNTAAALMVASEALDMPDALEKAKEGLEKLASGGRSND